MTETPISRDDAGRVAWRRDAVVRLTQRGGVKLHRAAITKSNHAFLYCDKSQRFREPGTWAAHDGEEPTCNSCVASDALLVERGFDPEEVFSER